MRVNAPPPERWHHIRIPIPSRIQAGNWMRRRWDWIARSDWGFDVSEDEWWPQRYASLACRWFPTRTPVTCWQTCTVHVTLVSRLLLLLFLLLLLLQHQHLLLLLQLLKTRVEHSSGNQNKRRCLSSCSYRHRIISIASSACRLFFFLAFPVSIPFFLLLLLLLFLLLLLLLLHAWFDWFDLFIASGVACTMNPIDSIDTTTRCLVGINHLEVSTGAWHLPVPADSPTPFPRRCISNAAYRPPPQSLATITFTPDDVTEAFNSHRFNQPVEWPMANLVICHHFLSLVFVVFFFSFPDWFSFQLVLFRLELGKRWHYLNLLFISTSAWSLRFLLLLKPVTITTHTAAAAAAAKTKIQTNTKILPRY